MAEVIERERPKELLRWIETDDGKSVNIIVNEQFAACFPVETVDQVKFLIDRVNAIWLKRATE